MILGTSKINNALIFNYCLKLMPILPKIGIVKNQIDDNDKCTEHLTVGRTVIKLYVALEMINFWYVNMILTLAENRSVMHHKLLTKTGFREILYLDPQTRAWNPAPRAGFYLRAGIWAWIPARDRAENEKQKKLKKSCSCSGVNSVRQLADRCIQ